MNSIRNIVIAYIAITASLAALEFYYMRKATQRPPYPGAIIGGFAFFALIAIFALAIRLIQLATGR